MAGNYGQWNYVAHANVAAQLSRQVYGRNNNHFSATDVELKLDQDGERIHEFNHFVVNANNTLTIMRSLRWNITCWTCPKVQMTQYVEKREADILLQFGLPADVPPCGFTGEKCIPRNYTTTIIVVASVAAFVALLIVVICVWRSYQNGRLESMIWRLDSAQIQVESN